VTWLVPFVPEGSAALIAAFTAIPWPEAETVSDPQGRSEAEDGRGQLFCFAMQSRPSAANHRAQRDKQKLGGGGGK